MKLNLPEIIYSSSNPVESRKIKTLLEEGKIRKILPKAYTSNFLESDNEIIRKHLFPLINKHYPEAIISHRTAIEYTPSPNKMVYLTSTQNRVVKWGDITLKFTKGPGRLENDHPIYGNLAVSSMERAYLENLTSSRKSDGESRTVDESIIENKLLTFLNKEGEEGLNEFRDRARKIADKLGMKKEFKKLSSKISAILSTKPSNILKSPLATAQAFGVPYDAHRLNLFIKLAGALKLMNFKPRSENATSSEEFRNFAFFESYFSNYIEGTTFEIEEAIDIVYNNKIIPNRQGDTHDVKGTFQICSDKFQMNQLATNGDEFIELLKERHAVILAGRPDKEPGKFKDKSNRAGNTYFVLPNMVVGTLKAAFDSIATIPSALGKAVYMMFLVSEVHPFNDGNGRIARVMMNAELVNRQEQRILIPTAYRDDYIGALRKLTRKEDPDAYIRMLDRIHDYSKWLSPTDFQQLLLQLKNSNAFEEPDKGKLTWGMNII